MIFPCYHSLAWQNQCHQLQYENPLFTALSQSSYPSIQVIPSKIPTYVCWFKSDKITNYNPMNIAIICNYPIIVGYSSY